MTHEHRIEISYDHEGCSARLYSGNEITASTYEFVRTAGTWQQCRDRALSALREKASLLDDYGPKPANETIPLPAKLEAVND